MLLCGGLGVLVKSCTPCTLGLRQQTGQSAAASGQARSGRLACVPLMMTLCAGRLTPQASVAVDTSTCHATKLLSSCFASLL